MSTEEIKSQIYSKIAWEYCPDKALWDKLQIERGLTDDQILTSIMYPIEDDVVTRVLADGKFDAADLIGIPGFYKEGPESSPPTPENVKFKTQSNVDYVIIVRDEEGRILGLSARYKGYSSRYGWYSSKNYPSGVTSGAPMGVLEGLGYDDDYVVRIAVCEGFFKGAAVARTMNVDYVIYASGVQNTASMVSIITRLAQGCKTAIVIVPDTDCWCNPAVMRADIKMIRYAQEVSTDITVAAWCDKYGKGYDDVVLAGKQHKIVLRPAEAFLATAHEWAEQQEDEKLVSQIEELWTPTGSK